jgi:hypothetical protein
MRQRVVRKHTNKHEFNLKQQTSTYKTRHVPIAIFAQVQYDSNMTTMY